jgi:hypothetical protein
MKTAVEDEAHGLANMTANERLQFLSHFSDAVIDTRTWSLADTERVAIPWEREIYGITNNANEWVRKEFSIRLIGLDAWWQTISIQEFWKSIEKHVI